MVAARAAGCLVSLAGFTPKSATIRSRALGSRHTSSTNPNQTGDHKTPWLTRLVQAVDSGRYSSTCRRRNAIRWPKAHDHRCDHTVRSPRATMSKYSKHRSSFCSATHKRLAARPAPARPPRAPYAPPLPVLGPMMDYTAPTHDHRALGCPSWRPWPLMTHVSRVCRGRCWIVPPPPANAGAFHRRRHPRLWTGELAGRLTHPPSAWQLSSFRRRVLSNLCSLLSVFFSYRQKVAFSFSAVAAARRGLLCHPLAGVFVLPSGPALFPPVVDPVDPPLMHSLPLSPANATRETPGIICAFLDLHASSASPPLMPTLRLAKRPSSRRPVSGLPTPSMSKSRLLRQTLDDGPVIPPLPCPPKTSPRP